MCVLIVPPLPPKKVPSPLPPSPSRGMGVLTRTPRGSSQAWPGTGSPGISSASTQNGAPRLVTTTSCTCKTCQKRGRVVQIRCFAQVNQKLSWNSSEASFWTFLGPQMLPQSLGRTGTLGNVSQSLSLPICCFAQIAQIHPPNTSEASFEPLLDMQNLPKT